MEVRPKGASIFIFSIRNGFLKVLEVIYEKNKHIVVSCSRNSRLASFSEFRSDGELIAEFVFDPRF